MLAAARSGGRDHGEQDESERCEAIHLGGEGQGTGRESRFVSSSEPFPGTAGDDVERSQLEQGPHPPKNEPVLLGDVERSHERRLRLVEVTKGR